MRSVKPPVIVTTRTIVKIADSHPEINVVYNHFINQRCQLKFQIGVVIRHAASTVKQENNVDRFPAGNTFEKTKSLVVACCEDGHIDNCFGLYCAVCLGNDIFSQLNIIHGQVSNKVARCVADGC